MIRALSALYAQHRAAAHESAAHRAAAHALYAMQQLHRDEYRDYADSAAHHHRRAHEWRGKAERWASGNDKP